MSIKALNLLTHKPGGIHTIEASAGTGKTYTIKVLFLKALIELWKKQSGLGIGNILVVTFTEAATKELRFRIREILTEYYEWLETGTVIQPENHDLIPFFEEIEFQEMDKIAFKLFLKNELKNPDEASIYTIHGFCRTVMSEYPFECGITGNVDISNDLEETFEEFVIEEWRTLIRSTSFANHAIEISLNSPDDVIQTYGQYIKSQGKIAAEASIKDDLNQAHERLNAAKSAIINRFSPQDLERLVLVIFSNENLLKSVYKFDSWMSVANGLINTVHQAHSFSLFSKAENLTRDKIESSLKKNTSFTSTAELNEFFDLYEELYTLLRFVQEQNKSLIAHFLHELQVKWQGLKQEKALFGFDDLLKTVNEAVNSNADLVKQLQTDYPFAFIDEFQDTDPIQFSIFEQVYLNDSTAVDGLYMIGDPKQSIYSFRNADLNTYLYAKNKAQETFELTTNYRSVESVVESVNQFYGLADRPFINQGIEFRRVNSKKRGRLIGDESFTKPMLAVFQSDEFGGSNKSIAERTAIRKTIEIVQYYLNGALQFEDADGLIHDIKPKDLAILVKTNTHADNVYKSLRKAQIPAVIYSKKSVFNSNEAHLFSILLQAILSANRFEYIKSSLLTSLFSFTLRDLDLIENDEDELLRIQSYFLEARSLWNGKGVAAAISFIVNQFNCQRYLLELGDGERSIANWMHMLDLAGKFERESRRNPQKTWHYIQQKIAKAAENDSSGNEEELLRLESDDDKVKIVTIHSSKGLEYPIVIQPFAWGRKNLPTHAQNKQVFTYSGLNEQGTPEIQLILNDNHPLLNGVSVKNANAHANEEEEARQFYVALTRAKWQNVLIIPENNSIISDSLPFSMLEKWAFSVLETPVLKIDGKKSKTDGYGSIRASLNQLEISQPNVFACIDALPQINFLSVKKETQAINEPKQVVFSNLKPDFQTTSYSGMVHGLSHGSINEDEFHETAEIKKPKQDIVSKLTIKAGAEIGNVIHNTLEKIQSADETHVKQLVISEINQQGYNDLFDNSIDLISSWIHEIYTTECTIFESDTISLQTIPAHHQKREMEFHLKSGEFDVQTIVSTLRGESDYSLLIQDGFIKGFMDLVFVHKGQFYLMDYKSNYLGDNLRDYALQSLERAMINSNYDVQMAIYTLALHQYLKNTIQDYSYEIHFGGMLYWFVRGIEAPNKGLYFHKLDYKEVVLLEEKLLNGGLK
ncbi:exodeoxyribonuclease V subunit beta [bacterium]|nr:MAG: exodeoxyribonuclease V subunit beta [bacterium]